ncbi:DUF397 domain-containing protein [Streptomyces sioyaensis]|uniref:DUF397 domain-containing protein n=1 Tax=Streptomyces sioyaensis TaxID=67364 RepID=A0A4Q1QK03_9ACTN|nr:DUF397 domain-containing protein [Streptomyces sioyaensis]MBM4794853.1 DUF397 domain-containing protein [Streptomyces sioyaensis]RXS58802.1 DUF397 domain-containing protein [Streptomyces sioyaensis]
MNTIPDLTGAVWRKSSYSDGGADNCVEVADGFPDAVPVRDSKNPEGPALLIPAMAWADFIRQAKADWLD